MANVKCKYCGAAIDSFSTSCAYCGMKVESTGNSTQDFINGALNSFSQATKKIDNAMSNKAQEDKVYGVLAYLGFLWFVPFFLRRDSKFVLFHLNQGLVLFICSVATSLLSFILSAARLPFGGLISLLNVVWFIFVILGIVHAAQGDDKTELPIIGQFKILK